VKDHFPDAPRSLWLDTYGTYTPSPPLETSLSVDVAIIGGGFTGLATAHELKRADPQLKVVVLEAQEIGYGSSGRNGSFAMTVIGLGIGVTALLKGKDFLQRAHTYMMEAVDGLDQLIIEHDLECDRIRPGFLRVATTKAYVKRIQHDIELINALGFEDIEWLDREAVHERVNSPHYLGALWEPRLVLINPLKLVREEKRLAVNLGADVFEYTPVLEVNSQPTFQLKTPKGTIKAEKVVFATNAYSHLFPELKRKQIPSFTYMLATEPLTSEQLDPIGWQGREGVEDARNLIHYYRLTPDNRLVMGGGPVGLTWANKLTADGNPRAWEHLEEHIHFLFPSLRNVAITHRWGGPFSVTLNLVPALGFVGDERAVYSLGCIGHGVSLSHRNAQVIRDLILEKDGAGDDCPFLNQRVIPWPPEPLRLAAAYGIRSYLLVEDYVNEWSLHRS